MSSPSNTSLKSEKGASAGAAKVSQVDDTPEVNEVFGGVGEDGVDFRSVGWIKTSLILLKMTFAAGVLSIPSAFGVLGAVLGCVTVVFWGLINTYTATVQGNFRNRYRQVHTIADMGMILGGPILREILGGMYLFTWIVCTGISTLGLAIALNALSDHGTCSVTFGFVSFVAISILASVRKLANVGLLMLVGFVSIFSAIMIVTVAVNLLDRPAAAPEGDFDLGFQAGVPSSTTFSMAFSAILAIFSSSANTCGYTPVHAEMRNPLLFNRSVYVTLSFITSAYIWIPMLVYSAVGVYSASPALGSAGPLVKKIAYGVGIPGLLAGALLCQHLAGKYCLVRILRNSEHLTKNSKTHWFVWLGSVFGCGVASFILFSVIPFFGSLVSLVGAICFAPLALCLPAFLWWHLNPGARTGSTKMRILWWLHGLLFVWGVFVCIAGSYAVIADIVRQFQLGTVGSPFSCADNSNST